LHVVPEEGLAERDQAHDHQRAQVRARRAGQQGLPVPHQALSAPQAQGGGLAGLAAEGPMARHDHHDWASESYVGEWVKRQQTEAPGRADRCALMCDLFPFPRDAAVSILDIGAGYGPVSMFILDRYPRATCVGQDGSEPMLRRARSLLVSYGDRFRTHLSDLFARDRLPSALRSLATAA